jgi:Tfp pilus assembly major pilin PilA
MEKKDIIIIAFVVAMLALSLYQRYTKKKKSLTGNAGNKTQENKGLSGQPDDYEPYSKGKS